MSDVPEKTHDRDFFYKYRSAKSAIDIISKLQICCSSPLLFNDPFDTLIELRPGFDPAQTHRLFWERFQQIKHAKISYECPRTTTLGWLINYFKDHPEDVGPEIPFESISSIFDDINTKAIAEKILSESNAIWMDFLQNDRIFCMSETYEEILMWSHYADHHRGAVIEFMCLPELDRPFNVADKVRYTILIPKFGTFDEWFDHSTGRKPMDNWNLSSQYSFKFFIGFTPAISRKAEKAIRDEIRSWKLHLKSGENLDDFSKTSNPKLRGWIRYYGKFRISALIGICRMFQKILVNWAKHKFKHLKRSWAKSRAFMRKIAITRPVLFIHWEQGLCI